MQQIQMNIVILKEGMHRINQLGPHIVQYSLPINDDKNGSWCTCHNGAPFDVCHLQFGAIIAFKLVWCPENAAITTTNQLWMAMLIDNDGNLLNYGIPLDQPHINTKMSNWKVILNSKDIVFKTDIINLCSTSWQMNKKEL